DIRRDVLRWRHRVLKLLARHGRAYLTGKNWSHAHWRWIREQRFELPPLQRAFEATVFALEQALARQAELDKELEALAATAPYREPVGWLRCFRGIDTLSAIILLAEVVDFQRFRRPRELMAYLGLVPSEYSSGECQRRGALTKAGNSHARRILVEAAWHYRHRPTSGRALATHTHRQRDAGVPQARRESPRGRYATPGVLAGTARAPRRRQLPTKRCHAALLFGVIRAYQPDSSSKPLHRQPCVGVLGKSFRPTREMPGSRHRRRDRRRRHKPLDGRSFHISESRTPSLDFPSHPRQEGATETHIRIVLGTLGRQRVTLSGEEAERLEERIGKSPTGEVRKRRDFRSSSASMIRPLAMDLDREACYRAVKARDRRFDGRFLTGVLSTGIF